MIAIATSVSYGGNYLRYSTKKEDADIVKIHKLPEGLPATTMWKMMEATQLKFRAKLNRHRPLVNTLIKIEHGDEGVAIGLYFRVLIVLGLERDLINVAKDDILGRKLQDIGLVTPKRATKR